MYLSVPPSHSPVDPPCDPAPHTVDDNYYAEVQLKTGHLNTTTQLYAVIAPQPAVAPSVPPPGCPSTPSSHSLSELAPSTVHVDENYAVVQKNTIVNHYPLPDQVSANVSPQPGPTL